MGIYAKFDDVNHPTETWELGDCTACGDTGWVDYPTHVGVDESEKDPCPRGCVPEEDRPGYYIDFEPEAVIETELIDALWKSRRGENLQDPFKTLSQAANRIGLKPWSKPSAIRRPGKVSSDLDLMGLLEDDLHKQGDGLLVTPCTVPAYLVGKPLTYDKKAGVLRVQYEYMGSFVTIRYARLELGFMRFAYSWDSDYATSQVL